MPTYTTTIGGSAQAPSTWTPAGVPGTGDTELIQGGTVSYADVFSSDAFTLLNRSVRLGGVSAAVLAFDRPFDAPIIALGSTTSVLSTAAGSSVALRFTNDLNNAGLIEQAAADVFSLEGSTWSTGVHPHSTPANLINTGTVAVSSGTMAIGLATTLPQPYVPASVQGTIYNAGTLLVTGGTLVVTAPIVNGFGKIIVSGGTAEVARVSGDQSVDLAQGALLRLDDPTNFLATVHLTPYSVVNLPTITRAGGLSYSGNGEIDVRRGNTYLALKLSYPASSPLIATLSDDGTGGSNLTLIPARGAPFSRTVTGIGDHAIATFNAQDNQYTIATLQDGSITVTDGAGDVVTSINNEMLQFTDQFHFILSANDAAVARLYSAGLGRLPDPVGLFGWEDLYANNVSANAKLSGSYVSLAETSAGFNGNLSIADGIIQSPESIAKYGSTTDAQFVTQLYNNVLGRDPDAAGLNGWLGAMAGIVSPNDPAGIPFTRAMVLVGFAESTEAVFKADAWITQTG